jgi:hypothetical protein
MGTSLNGQMKELQDMMMNFMQSNKPPTPPTNTTENCTPIVQNPSLGAPSVAETMEEEVVGSETDPNIDPKANGEDDNKSYSEVPIVLSESSNPSPSHKPAWRSS